MIIPKFWAQAVVRHRDRNRQVSIRRFGWSNQNQDDAQRNAEERAQDALQRVLNGERLEHRERNGAYNGSVGVPIREEVIVEYPYAVITRNGYGAHCLNTANVLFADIDFDAEDPLWVYIAPGVLYLAGAALVAFWSLKYSLQMLLATFIGWPLLYYVISGLRRFLVSDPARKARRNLRRFANAHPDWHLRIYETPNGLRILAMHRTFNPREPDTVDFFNAIGVDPVYARMCSNQNCFRARVSPKPWRIGIKTHIKPRRGTWPVQPERLPARKDWIARYESAAREYASCRFVEALGPEMSIDRTADAVRKLHDDLCRSTAELPIA